MAQSYEEKNSKYRKDIQKNYSYLTGEIPLGPILPHLQEILHHSDYELLRRRSQNHSDWDCNQELLSRLQKREYWWQAFREALVGIDRPDIIERLGWDKNNFDFGPRHTSVEQNSGASYNPPEKPNMKQQTVEEYTQQKLDVYKKQNDLAKGLNPTRNENNQPEQREVDPNLFSLEEKKLNTDFKTVLTDENDLGKVLKPEIHPAVRRNLPMNFPNSAQEENLSNYDASASPFQSSEISSRDEVNPNNSPTSNSPQSMDNSQSLRSINNPPQLDHSMSAPTMCTEPGAVFPPNDSSVRQTDIPAPTQNVSTSAIHHSLSAPSMNRAPIHERQQHDSADTDQEVLRTKNEADDYFESSINSAEQSTLFVRPTSNPGANIEPSDGRSNAERQEINLREQNLELCDKIKDENPNPGSSRSQNFEDGVIDDPTSATAFQEIRPQTSNCQSNMAFMTTNDDVIKPSIASTVDPKGVSRSDNVRGEKTIRHKSSSLNREPDSYVTGLHSYGSDVTSSIRSGGQSSTLLSQDHDQTNVKTFESITRVDALDNYNFNNSDLDSSSILSPDAMRLDSGSVPSAPSADPPGTEELQHDNSSSGIQDSASAQNLGGTMPNFDSLLSGSHQSLPSIANQNLALSELPFAGNGNFPEFSELLSMGSSVDPAEHSEPGAFSPVSVAHPPSTGQLAELDGVSVNVGQDHEGAGNDSNDAANDDDAANDAANDAAEPPPSVFQRIWNSIGHSVESVFETLIPSSECSE